MLTEEEARKQNLPGSDVFLRTQLAYKTELNRDALIVYLNREAYKAFVDTITIGQYPQLKEETERTIRNTRLHPNTVFRRIEYMDLENFKIAAGFVQHLKACLLSNDIVIHVIANTPPYFLDIVGDYRNLRNQIHLPGDPVEAPHINKYMGDSLMRILVQFINEEIVEYNNKLIDKWELNTASKLPPLTYF
jgi:hypothetical protein